MKCGPMIEYNNNTNFPQNLVENEARRLVPDLFLFFRKALYEANTKLACSLVSIYFESSQLGIQYQQVVQQFKILIQRLLIQRYAQF